MSSARHARRVVHSARDNSLPSCSAASAAALEPLPATTPTRSGQRARITLWRSASGSRGSPSLRTSHHETFLSPALAAGDQTTRRGRRKPSPSNHSTGAVSVRWPGLRRREGASRTISVVTSGGRLAPNQSSIRPISTWLEASASTTTEPFVGASCGHTPSMLWSVRLRW
jgi:hypothetical protein